MFRPLFLATRREVHDEGYIAMIIETMHMCTVPGFKIYGLKHILKI